MDRGLDSTRGFQKRDPRWHTTLETVATVGEVVELTRDYLATLRPDDYAHLPLSCRALRVKAEDDIEYWTLRCPSGTSRPGPKPTRNAPRKSSITFSMRPCGSPRSARPWCRVR